MMLPFTKMDFLKSSDSINAYKLTGKITLTFNVSLDRKNKLKDFSFIPYREEIKPSAMTPRERKTDSLAQRVLALINRKQADSIYLFAGDYFKSQLSAAKWKGIAENGLFPLTPLPQAVFMNSTNGINKYRLSQYQFVFGALDKQGKFNALAIQPYTEAAVKGNKAPTDNKLSTHLDSVVDKTLSAYIQAKGNVGLSAGVFYKGKEYFYNYGEKEVNKGHTPNEHTLYDIGSITKTFTSALLAIAVSQGKLTLETPVTKFLPDSVAKNQALKNITFKELANHTSGLPGLPDNFVKTQTDINQPYMDYGVKEMFAYLASFKQARLPGTKYEYSNFAVGLLGVLLERIYHKPYQQLIKQYITGPLEMNETVFKVDTNKANFAQGYNEQDQAAPFWNFIAFQSAGAIKSSTYDMLRYAKAQLFTSISPLDKGLKLTHQVTYNDGTHIVGLGWHYLQEDKNVLQHSGATGGYRTNVSVDLEKHIAIVVLTNNSSTGDATGIYLIKAIQAIGE